MNLFILLVLVLSAVFVIELIIENVFLLDIRHENLGGDLKIFHISDLHKRNNKRYNDKIINAAKKESPDIIFITGDLVSRTETDFSPSFSLLTELCRIAPVYMCMGNHEQSLPEPEFEKFSAMIKKTAVKLLVNSGVTAVIKGKKYYICGVEFNYSVYKKDESYRDLDKPDLAEMERLLGAKPDEKTFLLAHNPLFAEVYSSWGADLTFSGHVHGGVVRLFGHGLLSPERKFLPEFSKGIYEISGNLLLVSAGIGKLRLFDPPEITTYLV